MQSNEQLEVEGISMSAGKPIAVFNPGVVEESQGSASLRRCSSGNGRRDGLTHAEGATGDDSLDRCPLCKAATLAKVERLTPEEKARLKGEFGKRSGSFGQWVYDSLESFELSEDDEAQARIAVAFEQLLPEFARAATLAALLPWIEIREQRHFAKDPELRPDAEDLGADIALKIWSALFRTWPRGNLGAWVAQIRRNVASDGKERREHVGDADDVATLAITRETPEDRAILRDELDRLSELERKIVEMKLNGFDWSEIAASLGMTEAAARKSAQRLLPFGGKSSPSARFRTRRVA
ncbi:MAG: RNA polymerase sigma factor [Planctomycetaceae bacterium]